LPAYLTASLPLSAKPGDLSTKSFAAGAAIAKQDKETAATNTQQSVDFTKPLQNDNEHERTLYTVLWPF
jgi:hypothetical protein